MTNAVPQRRQAPAVDIWLLVSPNFLLLDATGPIQVFSTANDEARDAGLPTPYRIHLISPQGGPIASSSGVAMMTASLPTTGMSGSTLLVSGGRIEDLPDAGDPAGAALLKWLALASADVARCCSVCTGAFVLARAGLLAGRRVVTHWADIEALRAEHPSLQIQDDALHVTDGKFHTSAGISAGMDLALSLVEEDLGRAMALGVARRMVLFLKRPGGQRQFSTELLAQSLAEGITGQLTAWLRPRLSESLCIEQMAAACAVSVRTLHRKVRQEASITPAQLLLRLRTETACSLLEQPEMTVKQAARLSGYGSEYNLRRAFSTQFGVLPSEYRERFAIGTTRGC